MGLSLNRLVCVVSVLMRLFDNCLTDTFGPAAWLTCINQYERQLSRISTGQGSHARGYRKSVLCLRAYMLYIRIDCMCKPLTTEFSIIIALKISPG